MIVKDLSVKEIKELLKEYNCAVPTGAKKKDLIALAEDIMMTEETLEKPAEYEELFDMNEVQQSSEIQTEEVLDAPSITSPEWHEYAMSHFYDNELIDGNPICAGLRRVAELLLGEILETGPSKVFAATDNDGPGRATVVYRVVFNWFNSGIYKTFSEVADVWHGNTDDLFCAHPVATASTRAEGRALRKALKLRVLAAEELAKKNIVEIVQQSVSAASAGTADQRISPQQVQFIDNKCNQLDIDVVGFINMGQHTYSSINDIDKDCAKKMITMLNSYQNGNVEISENIKGYKTDWR
tara:strand:- start:140 stop:1030 length:891 start_codon:yes stop_codon:yes gene_type:complete